MTLNASGPNAGQIEYWNETAGPKWVELADLLDQQIAALGLAAMDAASIAAGERVLDVGCGCGQTSLQLAERVGSEGAVIGLDISTVMLRQAEERAREARFPQVSFSNADAQTFRLEDVEVDLVFSRFGVMFFADPTGAFANLRGALAPTGRLAFVCWQRLQNNPWMAVPLGAVAKHMELPPAPPPGAPGPFSFADPSHVRGILEGAGFADVALEPLETELYLGGNTELERAVEFSMRMGPAAAALREADHEDLSAVRAELRKALEPFATSEGVRMDAAAWIATGRNP